MLWSLTVNLYLWSQTASAGLTWWIYRKRETPTRKLPIDTVGLTLLVLWVGALLATMLGLGRMFEGDYRDGSLEHMLLSPHSLGLMVLGKITAHWLLCGVPLVILAPVLGLQFDLSADALSMLCLTLLLGTPVLSCIGAIGAALTIGVRGGGILISLVVLPLFVPVLIFGSGAVQALESGVGAQAHVSILLAMLLPALFFSPWACSAGLRIALE